MSDSEHRPVRRLVRRARGREIAGVAGGIADYFSIDPVLVRVGFAVCTVFGGAGAVAYLVLWALLPEAGSEGPEPSGLDRFASRVAEGRIRLVPIGSRWITAALLGIGVLILARQWLHWPSAVFAGLGLVAAGIVLYVPGEDAPATEAGPPAPAVEVHAPAPPAVTPPAPSPEPPPATSPLEQPAPAFAPSSLDAPTPLPPVPPHPAPPLPPPPVPPVPPLRPRERSPLGWIALGVAAVAIGVAALLERASMLEMDPGRYAALALTVLGLALVVGARWGRARWLVAPALALAVLAPAAGAVAVPIEGGFGTRAHRPLVVAEVPRAYRLIAGQMTVDLRSLEAAGSPVEIVATIVTGRLTVLLPPGVAADVRARTGFGRVAILDSSDEGADVEVRRLIGAPAADALFLRLDLEVSMGEIEVRS